jgi:serine/threonine protein kinase/TolA-binding protein
MGPYHRVSDSDARQPGVMIGRTITHYRVLDQIGSGGMGVVYRAEDLRLGRHVALKFLPEEASIDRQAVERFHREARAASSLNHPNICVIYEIDQHEGQQFIAMELLEGQPLSALLKGRPLPLRQVIEYAVQIADALDVAHSEGIVHRDVKPANVFITRRGQVKVLDFGLAKLERGRRERQAAAAVAAGMTMLDELSTTPGVSVGTVAYMSPEQARAEELDARTDLFSAGLVLYEMATGTRTFSGPSTAVIFDAILNRTPPAASVLNPQVPPELDRIIGKAIEKERGMRYQTAADWRSDLQRLRRDLESAAAISRAAGSGSAAAAGRSAGMLDDLAETAATPAVAAAAPRPDPLVPPPAVSGSGSGVVVLPATSPSSASGVPPAAFSGSQSLQRPWWSGPAGISAGVLALGAMLALGVWLGRGSGTPDLPASDPDTTSQPSSSPTPVAAPVESRPAPAEARAARPDVPAPDRAPAATPSARSKPVEAATPGRTAGGGAGAPTGALQSSPPLADTVTPRETQAAIRPGPRAAGRALRPGVGARSAAVEAEAAKRLEGARQLIQTRQLEKAAAELRAITSEQADSSTAPVALLWLGQVQERIGRVTEALATFDELMGRYPDSTAAGEALTRRVAAVMQSRRRDREAAARAIITAQVDQHPASPWAGDALTARGRIEEGARLRVRDPALGDMPLAVVTYRVVAERYPARSEYALSRLAEIYESLRRYALAADALVQLGTRFPATRPDPWFRAGDIYQKRLKDPGRAREAFAHVAQGSPQFGEARKRIADLSR